MYFTNTFIDTAPALQYPSTASFTFKCIKCTAVDIRIFFFLIMYIQFHKHITDFFAALRSELELELELIFICLNLILNHIHKYLHSHTRTLTHIESVRYDLTLPEIVHKSTKVGGF